jgi:hypothetical protein
MRQDKMRYDETYFLKSLSIQVSSKEGNKSQKDQKNNKASQGISEKQTYQSLNDQIKIIKPLRLLTEVVGIQITNKERVNCLLIASSSNTAQDTFNIDGYKLKVSGCEFSISNINKHGISIENRIKLLM